MMGKSRIRNARVFALLSLFLSGAQLCQGAESRVITGSQEYTTDQVIDVPSSANRYDDLYGFQVGSNQTVRANDGVSITVNMGSNQAGAWGAGVYVSGANSLFDVDQLTITDENADGGNLAAGSVQTPSDGSMGLFSHGGAKIKVGNDASIRMAQSAVSASGGTIEIGDRATLTGNVYGNGSGAVSADFGGQITIGDGATIINDGRTLTGYESHHYAVNATNGNIEIGDNSYIGAFGNGNYTNVGIAAGLRVYQTEGTVQVGKNAKIEASSNNQPIALYVTRQGSKITIGEATSSDSYIRVFGNKGIAVYATLGGEIELGAGQNISTDGDESYGIYAGGDGSKVTVGSGTKTTVGGANSFGIVALNGGAVRLLGDQEIQVDMAQSRYAIHASRGASDSGTDISSVTGDGKMNISGRIYAGDRGSVDITFRNGSEWIGSAGINESGTVAGEVNFTFDEGSRWEMTDNSQMTNLDLLGGTIHFQTDLSSGQYGELAVEDLSSSSGLGTFYMRADMANQNHDVLRVTGSSSGNHQINVSNHGNLATTGRETLTLVETADGGAAFGMPRLAELGGYLYDLRRAEGNNNHWELYGLARETSTALGSANLYLGSYLLNYAENQTLLKRLGDLRDGAEENGIWARMYGGKFERRGDQGRSGFDMDYYGIQTGMDKKITRKDQKAIVYVGGFAGYSKGSLDYHQGSGDTELKYLGAYWTHIHRNGFYADAVLKYGWMNSDFKAIDTGGNQIKGKGLDTNTWSGSLEIGRKYYQNQQKKSGWYVEPQAQLMISHQDGDEVTASNGLRIQVKALRSIQGRIGLRAGYEIKGGKNPINLYGKISQVKEFDGDLDYSLNGSKESTSYKDNWWVYGIGMNAQLGSRHQVYFDIEKTSGDQFDQEWGISGGYRYAW